MIRSRLAVAFLAAAVLAAGCQKQDAPATPSGGPPPPADPPRKGRPKPGEPAQTTTTPAAAKAPALLPDWAAFADKAKIPTDVVVAWTQARAVPGWFGLDAKNNDYRTVSDPAQLVDPVPAFRLSDEFRAGTLEQLPTPPVPFALAYTDRHSDDFRLKGVGKHPTLAALDLQGSAVTDKTLEEVGTLPNLKTLVLSSTNVGDAGMKHVGRLTGLTALAVNTTKTTDAGLAHLKGLTNLTRLDLWGTRLLRPGPAIAGFTRLRSLRLPVSAAPGKGEVAAEAVRAVAANLKDLRELHLYLERHDFKDGSLAGLKEMKSLERLHLDTHLSPGDVEHFRGLTGLKYLKVGGGTHAVNPGITEALKAALPGCEVVGPK